MIAFVIFLAPFVVVLLLAARRRVRRNAGLPEVMFDPSALVQSYKGRRWKEAKRPWL